MQCIHVACENSGTAERPGTGSAFYLSGSDGGCEILWLCLGEYRGIKTIKAFMRYAVARYQSQQRDLAYRIYVAECLRMVTENTAKISNGSYTVAKFEDILNPKQVENRTGEEIAADIIKLAGIEVI